MEFRSRVLTFRTRPALVPLRRVWEIENAELAPIGAGVLKHLENSSEPLQSVYRDICWQGQALLEFQDLQEMPFPKRGRFMNGGYLYCESLSVLRQVVTCGLNGQVHASLAALRSSLEALVYHYWWKRKLFGADDYQEFYDWLFGKGQGANFTRVRTDTLNDLERPPRAFIFDELDKVYAKLCCYAHKALIDETVVKIRGGNVPQPSDEEIVYWLSLLQTAQRCMLDIAVLSTPQAVFPVALYRKFGFNPPVGIFFDHWSGYAVEKALGDATYSAYRKHFRNLDPPRIQLEWYESHPDLTDEEVLATWQEETPDDDKTDFEERLLRRAAVMKAKMRALLWGFSYQRDTIEISDITAFVRKLEEEFARETKEQPHS